MYCVSIRDILLFYDYLQLIDGMTIDCFAAAPTENYNQPTSIDILRLKF